ncbi:DUF2306 domain-containing protein [Allokutzneria oryzae]|uniref:DUF2306 domain-containing protein n=1 Tax=Allokutzneria oryzae TaxID=1378989 RepID=A0ABV5ZX22_9PSEU
MFRRPWIAPLAFVVIAFLAFSLPRYLSFDPARSLVPAPPDFPAHYPVLVAHILFGAVAMVTCALQVWPWLRQRHPAKHRIIGRVYVFAGVLPAGALGFVVGITSPFGPVAQVSHVLLSAMWLGFTVMGLVTARQRRMAEHRRWMVRSFALTMSIITNRLWSVLASVVLTPRLETAFGGSELALTQSIGAISSWLGWTIPLLAAQWWLDRGQRRRTRTAMPSSSAASPSSKTSSRSRS